MLSKLTNVAFNSNTSHATGEFNGHKDCKNNPIRQLGFKQLGSFTEYYDNKKLINQALIIFCKMGFPTFQPLATADADKWFNQGFPHQIDMNAKNTKRIREILALAGSLIFILIKFSS